MQTSEIVNRGAMFILFLVFMVLKLTHVIGWSWWWVTLPLWAWSAGCLVFAGLCFLAAGVVWVWSKR